MNFEKVVDIIEKVAPPELGEAWDNSGVQIGFEDQEVEKILLCLDITEDVIYEAIDGGFDMIISHHPLIFGSIDAVDERLNGPKGIISHYIKLLLQNNISVYSAHTSFDNAPKGNNYYLASILGLDEISDPTDVNHIGVTGLLKEGMNVTDMANHMERVLDLPRGYVRCTGSSDMIIKKVAICTGAGGTFLYDPFISDCDMLITGDVKLNQAMESNAMGISIADAGHFGTEKIFAENMIGLLKEEGMAAELLKTSVNTNPYML